MAVRLHGVLPAGVDVLAVGIVLVNADGSHPHPQPTLHTNPGLTRPIPGSGGLFHAEDGSGGVDAEGAFQCWGPDLGAGQEYLAVAWVGGVQRTLRLTPTMTHDGYDPHAWF